MSTVLLVATAVVLAILAAGLALSLRMTRRFHLGETRSPREVGLAFEEVAFAAADGLRLCGWWIPAPGSDRAVVVMHGHGGSMDCDVHRAPALHAAGFNVLLFDFRGHGRSPGRIVSFGYLDRQDVLGAVRFLKERGMRRIGLLGFSYGGIAAMLAAPLCPEIDAIVTDGGPARMRTTLAVWGVEHGVPRPLAEALGWLTLAVGSLRVRANLFRYEPVRWVGRIAPRPILFVHGELDQYLPDFDELAAAAGPAAEVWRVPQVGHTKVSEVLPDEFARRVLGFFQAHL